MAAILADDNFKLIFLNENDRIPIRISLKWVPRSPININTKIALAWRRTGDTLLPELMLTQFIDAYMRHCGGKGGGCYGILVWIVQRKQSYMSSPRQEMMFPEVIFNSGDFLRGIKFHRFYVSRNRILVTW